MLVRELKLRPTKTQTAKLEEWLWCLTGVYNWTHRKIQQDAADKIYHGKYDLEKSFAGVSKKVGVPSHTLRAIIMQAYNAWERCFKKISGQPRLKGVHNKLRSIPFPDPLKRSRIKQNRISLPGIKQIRYYKQSLPEGKIKLARVIRKASGWYCQLCIDTNHIFPVKDTNEAVGIDTGFKHLAILSNGEKFSNRREFVKGQKRLAQAQRGGRKKLAARLHEKISNRRRDWNHKVSRKIVEKFKQIFVTNDNLRGQAKIFGKSISDAGINQLRQYISYKSDNHNRKCVLVDSRKTTLTCSSCGSCTGPTGLSKLNVRNWMCVACGATHDRDVNAAMNILNFGLGRSHGVPEPLGGI